MPDRDALFYVNSTANTRPLHHHNHHHHHHHHNHHNLHHNLQQQQGKMAPSPENDGPPKAPDKGSRGGATSTTPKESSAQKDDKATLTVDDLNDGELRALLDEAANYKNPKDREGKSKLFNYLLDEAEEDERNARASRAGGSELVRYHNPSAARRGARHRKKRSSVSENMMHGGSLDNLAKEALYETSKCRSNRKSVSARQREGGSLPCNVNVPSNVNCHFLEEAAQRRKKEPSSSTTTVASPTTYTTTTSIDLESESLLEHDSLALQQQEDLLQQQQHHHQQQLTHCHHQTMPFEIVHYPVAQHAKFTILPVSPDGVDDPIQLPLESMAAASSGKDGGKSNKYGSLTTGVTNVVRKEEQPAKKMDENANEKVSKDGGLVEDKDKKGKKKKCERNVTYWRAENIKGHVGADIANDLNKVLEYLGENSKNKPRGGTLPANKPTTAVRSSNTEDKKKKQQQRTASSKGKMGPHGEMMLKKSNSLGEISTATPDFDFDGVDNDTDVVVLRNKGGTGAGSSDKRERRSWGNMESPIPLMQNLYSNSSMENLETADFCVVTKKKKSRKRRSSVNGKTNGGVSERDREDGGSSARYGGGGGGDPRRKSACSVPHSEKSNDSESDAESVHSMPCIDAQRMDGMERAALHDDGVASRSKISYADMARNSESRSAVKQRSPPSLASSATFLGIAAVVVSKETIASPDLTPAPLTKTAAISDGGIPDVNSIKTFPAIKSSSQSSPMMLVLTENNATTVVPQQHYNNNSIVSNNNIITNKIPNANNNNKTVADASTNTLQRNVRNNNVQTTAKIIPFDHIPNYTVYGKLPPNIPDVQTIDKMQLMKQGHHHHPYETVTTSPTTNDCNLHCDMSKRTNKSAVATVILDGDGKDEGAVAAPYEDDDEEDYEGEEDYAEEEGAEIEEELEQSDCHRDTRPPVVILSGLAKEVPDLVFGFDLNEQLLSEETVMDDAVEADFASRFVPPGNYTATSHNHDKIVSFIGAGWEEVIASGKFKYFSEDL